MRARQKNIYESRWGGFCVNKFHHERCVAYSVRVSFQVRWFLDRLWSNNSLRKLVQGISQAVWTAKAVQAFVRVLRGLDCCLRNTRPQIVSDIACEEKCNTEEKKEKIKLLRVCALRRQTITHVIIQQFAHNSHSFLFQHEWDRAVLSPIRENNCAIFPRSDRNEISFGN